MVDFSIDVADAAHGLRRASKNQEMWTKNTVSFTVELERNVTWYIVSIYSYWSTFFFAMLVRTSTASSIV